MFFALKKRRNIFSRLYRYRPKSAHTSRENFLRECFVLLLSSDERMLKKFLEKYLKFKISGELIIDSDEPYKNAFFDIFITDNKNFYTIIECKMGAEISPKKELKNGKEDQIEKYANLLKEMNFKKKGILYISQREPIKRRYNSIVFESIRWNDVKNFLEKEKLKNKISDFLRTQFIEFLTSHRVDRTIQDGRQLWKCEICGRETRGMGIRSHKGKHLKEFAHIIRNENDKIIEEFERNLKPYKLKIEGVINEAKTFKKIEIPTYEDSINIFEILKKKIPSKLWLYLTEQIKCIFSNNAYYKFYGEVGNKVQKLGINSLNYPSLIECSYENILKYKNK